MSESQKFEELSELQRLHLQTQTLIDQLESAKKQGAEAQGRVAAYYQEHGLTLGDGLRVLTGDKVDPSDQYVFLKLHAALAQLPQDIADLGKESPPASPVAAPLRALNHRYRI